MKYYAVRNGRQPGIYTSWEDCKAQTLNFSGAVFKSFDNVAAAEQYLQEQPEETPIKENLPFAYIDGSFSKKNGLYSWGGFINDGGQIHILQGTGNAAEYMEYRNITGEVRGAIDVIKTAARMGIPEICLFYDYAGIGQWASGEWDCNNKLSQYYRAFCKKFRNLVTVNYIHVKGHTGVEGNEIADLLAKEAAGVKLLKREEKTLQEFKQRAEQAQ